MRENALRPTALESKRRYGEQRKSLSTLFREADSEWIKDTSIVYSNDSVKDRKQDDDLVLLLSQYFRKYVKQSDAVPDNIDRLIIGTSDPLSLLSFLSLLFCSCL